jgi:hypothetical protein
MVALLLVRYRIDQSLPENLLAFYDNLFNLLLIRHDRTTKGGYVRHRKSTIGDAMLFEVFNGICFLARKAERSHFKLQDLYGYTKQALEMAGTEDILDNVIADITDITCLILEEGGECRFIHKSVQEYHAACFIKEQPDEHARKFYEAMRKEWSKWEQELSFLEMIDTYRFLKFFAIPDMYEVLDCDISRPPEVWTDRKNGFFTKMGYFYFLHVTQGQSPIFNTGSGGKHSWCLRHYGPCFSDSLRGHLREVRTAYHQGEPKIRQEIINTNFGPAIPLEAALLSGYLVKKVRVEINRIFGILRQKLQTYEQFVDKVESRTSVFDFKRF